MSFDDDLEMESGPYVVLSDGNIFDDAEDCEIAFLSLQAHDEVIVRQNRNRLPSAGPGYHFDSANPTEVFTIPLREIIRYYFENHPQENPLR